jgi:hypothetical protein
MFVVLALAVSGCAGRVASTQPAPASQASAPAPATDDWPARDAQLLRDNAAAFDEAARFALTNADTRVLSSKVVLSSRLARLSKRGVVWTTYPGDGRTNVRYVFFNNGTSDYPCPDGLVYSTSATDVPRAAALTTPAPVAQHWWTAAWDSAVLGDLGGPGPMEPEIATDSRLISGATRTITGTVGPVVDIVSLGALIIYVRTSESKPACVVLNASTTMHWPSSWGPVVQQPNADVPAVQHPQRDPGIGGRRIVVQVRTATLPSSGRRQDFAVDAVVSE